MLVTMNIEVTDQVCADIICTALEGGIGYWAQADKIKQDREHNYVSCVLCECDNDERFDWKAAKTEGRIFTLDYAAVRVGIERILSGKVRIRKDLAAQVATAAREDDADIDADAADCIVQAALLNELRYS